MVVTVSVRRPRPGLADVEACCDSKPGSSRSRPFGPEPLVFKVEGKMFALLLRRKDAPPIVNLKCDPERALILRASFPAITPGYHANKTHWNSLVLDGSLPASLVMELIDHSYDLAFGSKQSRKKRSTKRQE
jgi:predicted DNA-binding protein (MmcQ/YjbR family)